MSLAAEFQAALVEVLVGEKTIFKQLTKYKVRSIVNGQAGVAANRECEI